MRRLRSSGALWAGVALQVAPAVTGAEGDVAASLVVASFVLLVAFAVRNVRVVGMPIVLVGLCLNLGVVAANRGMPVRADAVRSVGGDPADVGDGSHHLATSDDRLTVLGDALPLPVTHHVVSFGDLILLAGLGNVVVRVVRPSGARRRARALPAGRVAPGRAALPA